MSNKDIKMMGKDTEMSFTRGKRTGFRNDMALREVGERPMTMGYYQRCCILGPLMF